MRIHTLPSQVFARDVDNAKRLAADGPVLITERGRPAFALLRIEDYDRITGKTEMSLLELMDSMPRSDGLEFEAQRVDIALQVPQSG